MEVLRNSFEALLPVVKDAIDAADFIAIDTELTGLGIEEAHRPEFLDTAEERYVKYRRAAQDFLVTQYGICTFTWDQKQSAYIARPFNFFVFPQTGSRNLGLDRHFTCQVESIEFLSRYNFDFNKWASQGVPFVNRTDEDRARRRIRRSAVQGDIPIDIGNKEFIDTTLATVADWLQNSSEKSTEVTAPTSYHRRLVHQEIRNKYNAALKTEGSSGKIKVSKMTDEEKLSDDREQQLEKELEQLVGFRKVIDLISASKKPVIGHNMYLDLCHTYQRFYRNLPEDIHDFKKGLKELFPRIYDTKHIALKNESIVNKLEQTALGDIFSRVKSPPFDFPVILEHSDFTGYEEGGNRFHEAGYDAYATGVIFSKMIGFITEIDGGAPISFDIPVLENVLNKVNILRTDMPHLNLTGEDETPEREHVFHLYDFPEETKSKDIYNEFQTFGNVGLNWLGDTACLVTLRELSSVPRVMEEFGPNADRSGKGRAPSFTYKLETYTDFFARHKGRSITSNTWG
ncbi:ribonuclease H-like domain-containing protein [Phlyctochytrium arcticum]|nr:ribonuclease H-like domain-containing protein [Phlyctochytrium arcticum]